VVLDGWLDLMILEVFSSLRFYTSDATGLGRFSTNKSLKTTFSSILDGIVVLSGYSSCEMSCSA